MQLYFITGNRHKFEEVKAFIPSIEQLDIDLTEIQEIDPQKIIAAKLQEALYHHTGSFIVEDTSLYLDCMDGLPGPLIKWFLKTIGNEGLVKITKTFGNNKAIAKTMIGYAKSKEDIQFFEGTVSGIIVEPRGDKGFGWDPIFQPDNQTKTFAEMSAEEKNTETMNMRRLALEKLKKILE